jgi:hypothetical protein
MTDLRSANPSIQPAPAPAVPRGDGLGLADRSPLVAPLVGAGLAPRLAATLVGDRPPAARVGAAGLGPALGWSPTAWRRGR